MSMGTFVTANVYCNMTIDNGWRMDCYTEKQEKNSLLSFDKNWREYEEGLGDL